MLKIALLLAAVPILQGSASCKFGDDYPSNPVGDITAYQEEPYSGNCNLDLKALKARSKGWTHFAALPKSTHYKGGATCGSCVKVKCSCTQDKFNGEGGIIHACQPGGKETILMVVDSCPPCNAGDIDVSYPGWANITGSQPISRYQGSWEFVPCPPEFVSGPPKIRFHPGSDMWYYKIQPLNHKTRISSVVVNGKELSLGVGEDFWYIGRRLQFPCKLTITSVGGGKATANLLAQTIIRDPVLGKIRTDKEFTLSGDL